MTKTLLLALGAFAALNLVLLAQTVTVVSSGGQQLDPTVHVCSIPAGTNITYLTGTVIPKVDPQYSSVPSGQAIAEIDLYPNGDGSWTGRLTYK